MLLLCCTTTAYQPPHHSHARTVAVRAQRTYTLTDGKGKTDLLEITSKAEGRTFVLDGSKMLTLYECSFFEGKLRLPGLARGFGRRRLGLSKQSLIRGQARAGARERRGFVWVRHCSCDGRRKHVTLTDLDACIRSGLRRAVRVARRAAADASRTGLSTSTRNGSTGRTPRVGSTLLMLWCVRTRVYSPEAIEPLANCIAHHLAEGGVVYAFSAERDWSDAKYARAAPSDLEEALLVNVGLRVATARSSITTASGVYDVVLHTAGRVADDTTGGRRSVLGATALAFAPRAHAVEADPRTDIKARADYVEKEAQDQGFRTSRVKVLAVEPGPTAATGCMRSRDADVVEIDYVGSVVDGGVFDRRSRFAAMLGSGEVLKGLELGLYDMCIGERRVLRVPPALAFGDRGSRAFGVPGAARHQPRVRPRSGGRPARHLACPKYDHAAFLSLFRREDLDFEQRPGIILFM